MKNLCRTCLDLFPLALLGFCMQAQGAGPCAKVPAKWKFEVQATSGPLCADVLLQTGEEGSRKLRVYDSGKLAFETEEAALCKTCGGVMGDPFQGLRWNGQTLAVDNQGGSRESWDETWKFAKRDKGWVVIGWERTITDRLAGSIWSESVNALTGKAVVEYQPGEAECEADPAHCKKGAKPKGQKRSCSITTQSPSPSQIAQLRDQGFACGLKTP